MEVVLDQSYCDVHRTPFFSLPVHQSRRLPFGRMAFRLLTVQRLENKVQALVDSQKSKNRPLYSQSGQMRTDRLSILETTTNKFTRQVFTICFRSNCYQNVYLRTGEVSQIHFNVMIIDNRINGKHETIITYWFVSGVYYIFWCYS